jgi:ApaG protein
VSGSYEATTRGVLVRVAPAFLPGQSDPAQDQYTWAYTVEVENRGSQTVRLISRHWIITDGAGRVEHVRGAGVVGEQPTLKPSEAFRYTSGCPLPTPFGEMRGSYQMVTEDGEPFDVEIPAFPLSSPESKKRMN